MLSWIIDIIQTMVIIFLLYQNIFILKQMVDMTRNQQDLARNGANMASLFREFVEMLKVKHDKEGEI